MGGAGSIRAAAAEPAMARGGGFTLVDLVAALAIAGLLACIAVPSYRAQVVRANRAQARAALLALAAAQENFHLECNGYAAVLDDSLETACNPPSLRYPVSTGPGSYLLAVTSADATGWVATATAVAGSAQETDERCRVFLLDNTGSRSATGADGTRSDVECWNR